MGRPRIPEEKRRKRRTVFLTEGEWKAYQSWLANHRGVTGRSPSVTHIPQRVSVADSVKAAPVPEAQIDPMPVRRVGEQAHIWEHRLKQWKKRNDQ